ncbi:MAG: DUF2878 family protein [Candidatus Kaiserbacteria bacterium]|nr:MAG: DUF2878 family protein [Candidatus Kaiserbacteria bacterium]
MIQKVLLASRIATNALPVVGMILLVPVVTNDYVLTGIYIAFIIIATAGKRDHKDRVFLLFGLVASFIAETIFISTGVETFERNSLLGIMPLWLPFMWAYIFIAIRRAVLALEDYRS